MQSPASDQPHSKIPRGLGGALKLLWHGRNYRVRLTTQKHLAGLPPEVGVQALHLQGQDSTQLLFMAMVSLARDLYARSPDGPREFEEFVRGVGLKFVDQDGEQMLVADLIQKR